MSTGLWLQALILVTGIVGQLMVAQRRSWGFYAWIVCNLGLIWTGLSTHPIPYGNVALYAFYTSMCVYSVYQWRRLDAQGLDRTYAAHRWQVRYSYEESPERNASHSI